MLRVQILRLLDEILDQLAVREMLLADPFVRVHLHAVDLRAIQLSPPIRDMRLTLVAFSNFFSAFRKPVKFMIYFMSRG